MATLLLDTSVIIDHLTGRKNRSEYLDDLVEKGHLFGCCTINITEVFAGLRTAEEEKTRQFLGTLHCLPVTPAIAEQAGLLSRDWRRKGHTLQVPDVTIAAVALAYQLPLLTDNQKHFPMPELTFYPLP